ncbi:MAG: hypothetical protein A2103_05210 [Gammaproteobacteria bacterium GWF2_41_13]|nr:MAG: hypothetical protein A2103_05210 [Gammaproteobacteria bacterium GWF2_41_13]
MARIEKSIDDQNILTHVVIKFNVRLNEADFLTLYQHGLRHFRNTDLTAIDFTNLPLTDINFEGATLALNQALRVIEKNPTHDGILRDVTVVCPKAVVDRARDAELLYSPPTSEDETIAKLHQHAQPDKKDRHSTLTFIYRKNEPVVLPGKIAQKVAKIKELRPRRSIIPSWLKTIATAIGVAAAIVSIAGIIPLTIYGCIKLAGYLRASKETAGKTKISDTPSTPPSSFTQSHLMVTTHLKAPGSINTPESTKPLAPSATPSAGNPGENSPSPDTTPLTYLQGLTFKPEAKQSNGVYPPKSLEPTTHFIDHHDYSPRSHLVRLHNESCYKLLCRC